MTDGFANHEHWNAVKDVCQRLVENGHRALLAGGCVRDLLMNREPHDFDIATSATPAQVQAVWPRALMVGATFGVSVLPFDGFQIEIATFRQDLEYRDGRRPEGVRFSTPEQDARRRDFTVNALFYDLQSDQVIDYVEGRKDLDRKLLRAVGRPDERFAEDKLRLLRAVRFSAQLGFNIETETLAAISRQQAEVVVVSRERVRDEITKLLKTEKRERGLRLLVETGLLGTLFPKLAHALKGEESAWLGRFRELDPADLTTGLAAFFAPMADTARTLLKELKLDSRQIDQVQFVLKNELTFRTPTGRLGDLIVLAGHPTATGARRFAASTEDGKKGAEQLAQLARSSGRLAAVLSGDALPAPYLSGDDAQAAGMKPGPELGRLLHEAYLLQLEEKFADREAALAWLKSGM